MLVSAQRLAYADSRHRILLLSVVDATIRRKKQDEKDLLIESSIIDMFMDRWAHLSILDGTVGFTHKCAHKEC